MAETPQAKNLEAMLARLEEGWRELGELLKGQGQQIRTKVMEAEKFVLVDGRGEPRGKLEWKEDGSAGLVLLDHDGKYRAWLGLKEDGSAYLTLKDRFGRICWEAPQEPRRRPGEAPPRPGGEPESRAQSPEVLERLEKLGTNLAGLRKLFQQSRGGAGDREEEPQPVAPVVRPGETDTGGSWEASRRLEQLERQQGRLKLWSGLLSALLLVALAGVGFTLAHRFATVQVASQPPVKVNAPAPGGEVTARALTIHDPAGGAGRAWLGSRDGGLCLDLVDREGKVRTTLGLDKEGDPSLKLYDRSHQLRAELALNPRGDPGLSLVDQAGLLRVGLGSISPKFQVPADLLERPLSSLVLFNQDGVPVWHAPLRWRR